MAACHDRLAGRERGVYCRARKGAVGDCLISFARAFLDKTRACSIVHPSRRKARFYRCLVAAFSFNKLVVFGVGLIGGSLERRLAERPGATGEVVGVGRSMKSVERALALGVIDSAVLLYDHRPLQQAPPSP